MGPRKATGGRPSSGKLGGWGQERRRVDGPVQASLVDGANLKLPPGSCRIDGLPGGDISRELSRTIATQVYILGLPADLGPILARLCGQVRR